MRDYLTRVLLSLTLVLGVSACGPPEEEGTTTPAATPAAPGPPGAPPATYAAVDGLRVLAPVEIGRSIRPDQTMQDATFLFIPTNEVWISVVVEGTAPKATLQARWLTAGGEVLEQSSQDITPNGHTVTAFHIARPNGWALGHYRVEVLLNGTLAGTRDFEVKEPPL